MKIPKCIGKWYVYDRERIGFPCFGRIQLMFISVVIIVIIQESIDEVLIVFLGLTTFLIIVYSLINKELKENSFSFSLALTLLFSILVFGMNYDRFIPYTYYALTNYSSQYDYYSADAFMEDIAEHKYVETAGMSFPLLSKAGSKVLFERSRIFFPKEPALAYIKFPKISSKDLIILAKFEKFEKNVNNFLREKNYKKSYNRNGIFNAIEDVLREDKDLIIFSTYNNLLVKISSKLSDEKERVSQLHLYHTQYSKDFMEYDELLSTIMPNEFHLFKEEFLQYVDLKLETMYEAESKMMTQSNIIYLLSDDSPDRSNMSTKEIKDFFTYLSTFPKASVLEGIVSEKKGTNWFVKNESYGYFFYTLFLSIYWFLALLMFFYHLIRTIQNMIDGEF